MRKTFPKEGTKKLKQEIRDLKSTLLKIEKENRFLRDEILNIKKPPRKRKIANQTVDIPWKDDFIERFKREVLGKT